MGYAVIMFVIMLLLAVSIALSANYGYSKDSQEAPLLAENAYAERETGKAQTILTINNTCLKPDGALNRYTRSQGTETNSGTYTLYLTIRNNGSIVLNPYNVTVLYNSSYSSSTVTNWEKNYDTELCEETNSNLGWWPPLTYVCMKISNIWIYTPGSAGGGNDVRLAMAAENGISTIAPTSPTNFTGYKSSSNTSYIFNWNNSYDEDGIAFYRLYAMDSAQETGKCPASTYATKEIPGDVNSSAFNYSLFCSPCNADYFYLTAVDKLQNEGVQSRAVKCNPSPGPCTY